MNKSTFSAIRAILDTDASLTEEQRKAILRDCQSPGANGSPHRSKLRLARPQEAASILGVSLRTLIRMADSGELHRVRLCKRTVRYDMRELEALVAQTGGVK